MLLATVCGVSVTLMGCGIGNNQAFNTSTLDLFSTSSKATQANASVAAEQATDVECPDVSIRNGTATLTISSTPKNTEPTALDVRYQGSIVRTARECHINAGVMTMTVGIEGRVITGPAGGAGSVEIPLRVAVVQEGVEPKTITSKFGRETVTIANSSDRVAFTHIESDISFPLPQPVSDIDKYVVYVGFDPQGAEAQKKSTIKRSRPLKPKPQQS
jgi:hypothetical protein